MTVSVGFAELFDRVEKHIGPRMTKVLIYTAWLAAMSFFISVILDSLVRPFVRVWPDFDTIDGWFALGRFFITILLAIVMAAWVIETYRTHRLRKSYEASHIDASQMLDEFRDYRRRTKVETDKLIENAEGTIRKAGAMMTASRHLHSASSLVASEMIAAAERKEVLTDDQIAALRAIVEENENFERNFADVEIIMETFLKSSEPLDANG